MSKNYYLLAIVVTITILLSGCKTDATKRTECEEAAEMLADEWLNQRLTAEDKAFLTNVYELTKEYGQEEDFKTFKHETGDVSDADFEQTVSKDYRELNAVGGANRYDDLSGKELDSTFVAYCYEGDMARSYSYSYVWETFELHTSQMTVRDSLIAYLKDEIWTGTDSAEYIKNVREVSFSPAWRFDSWTKELQQYKYLAFVHLEYYYPPIMTNHDTFESGFACARLSVFRIADKECLLADKRVFAVSSDELKGGYYTSVIIDGKPTSSAPTDESRIVGDLCGRLANEVKLQISKCCIPLVDVKTE